jgi:hypothetical protein
MWKAANNTTLKRVARSFFVARPNARWLLSVLMLLSGRYDKIAMEGTSIIPLALIVATNASPVIGFVGNEVLCAPPVRRNVEQSYGFYAHVFQTTTQPIFY